MKYKKYNNKRLGNTKSQSEAYCFKLTVTVLEVLLTTWNSDYFVPFWPLRTNKNFYFLDYPDRPLADGQMVMLLYTLQNFNAERDNNTRMIEVTVLSELLIIVFHLNKFMKSHQLYPSQLVHICVYA
jgi:membrane-bound metal-dependent hydrolase YbcI (DUF457 family)